MWQTKYASAVSKNLGVGVNFRPCSEDYFLSDVRSPWVKWFKLRLTRNCNFFLIFDNPTYVPYTPLQKFLFLCIGNLPHKGEVIDARFASATSNWLVQMSLMSFSPEGFVYFTMWICKIVLFSLRRSCKRSSIGHFFNDDNNKMHAKPKTTFR